MPVGQFGATELCVCADRIVKVTTPATDVTSVDASAAGAKDAAQIPAYRLAQDVATEKILAALAATRDGPGNPARVSLTRGPCQVPAANARDGRRGNQPWSVITTPVSA